MSFKRDERKDWAVYGYAVRALMGMAMERLEAELSNVKALKKPATVTCSKWLE